MQLCKLWLPLAFGFRGLDGKFLHPEFFFLFVDHILLHGEVFFKINIIPFPFLQVALVINKEGFFPFQNVHQHQNLVPSGKIFPVRRLNHGSQLHCLARFAQEPPYNLFFREKLLILPFDFLPEIFIQANVVPLEHAKAALQRPADKGITDIFRNLAITQKHHCAGLFFLCSGSQISIYIILYVNFMPSPGASHLADIFGQT